MSTEYKKPKTFEEAEKIVNFPSKDFKEFIPIKGFDFSKKFNLKDYIKSLTTTGMESSHLGIAIEIAKKMRKNRAKIYLAFNSNMITSGLREIITYLVKNKLVHVLVTTAGGIEEDLMKCLGDFALGSFDADGKLLYKKRNINLAGNIMIPDNLYCKFEDWLKPILEEVYSRQKKTGKIISTNEFIKILGEKINSEDSYLYWAYKNQIPVFCPAIVDGAIGDQIAFFKYKHRDFVLDVSDDVFKITESTMKPKKTAIISLGSSFAKHFTLNANTFRGGADYLIIITTERETGGSDSGAKVNEAYTWGKIRDTSKAIKIHGDATIIFPLLVAGAFVD